MMESDISISAGGITLYELAATGTPTIVLCEEPFEVETAKRMEKAGMCINLGYAKNLNKNGLTSTVLSLIRDKKQRENMSKKGKALVDGRGVHRVTRIILDSIQSIT
jgi:UDP-2,4-diacetamido-2,4,6-trideoxy-beta-L-altropyranose hydrolase